jgi:hypothetical protein
MVRVRGRAFCAIGRFLAFCAGVVPASVWELADGVALRTLSGVLAAPTGGILPPGK